MPYQFTDNLPNRRVWPFQSGAITSKWKFEKGRYLLRCRIPSGTYLWPAFWLSGDCADEIDIFEFMQTASNAVHDRHISLSVHTKLPCSNPLQNNDTKTNPLSINCSEAQHLYGCDWDDFKIVFHLDGYATRVFYHYYRRRVIAGIFFYRAVESCEDIQPGETYFEDPQFTDAMGWVIINSAVRVGAPNSQLPKNMDLDYFRLMDLMNCSETIVLETQSDIEGAVYPGSYGDRTITAGQILIDPISSMALNGPPQTSNYLPGDLLVLSAASEIRILPGFDVNWDANLIGQITPCSSNKQPDSFEDFISIDPPTEVAVLGDSVIDFSVAQEMAAHSQWGQEFFVYPQPATTKLLVYGPRISDQIQVFDIWGKELKLHSHTSEPESNIDISTLAAGLYFIRIVREGRILSNLKFLKQ